jgi:hypothetical protein
VFASFTVFRCLVFRSNEQTCQGTLGKTRGVISSDGLRISTYVPAIAYSVLEPAEKKGILQSSVSQALGISRIARIFHRARHSGSCRARREQSFRIDRKFTDPDVERQ